LSRPAGVSCCPRDARSPEGTTVPDDLDDDLIDDLDGPEDLDDVDLEDLDEEDLVDEEDVLADDLVDETDLDVEIEEEEEQEEEEEEEDDFSAVATERALSARNLDWSRMYFQRLSSNFLAVYSFTRVALIPTTGTIKSGAEVTKFLPHSPVPTETSKLPGEPFMVMSVLLLAPATVRKALAFLAWIKNHDAGSVGSFENATSNPFSCRYISTLLASLSRSVFSPENLSVFPMRSARKR